MQVDLLPNPLIELMAIIARVEMPLAKSQLAATEGIAPIHPLHRLGHRVGADIDTIDMEGGWVDSRVEQGHGQRIGFLTGRTGQAQQPQRPFAGEFCQAFVGQADQRGE